LPGATANTANCDLVEGDLTDVGSYTGSASPYGTFDQGGNVWEWNEAINGSGPGLRGGGFVIFPGVLAASARFGSCAAVECHTFDVGFRVAMIPEPFIPVEIDIRPGSDINPVNPFSRGVIPVAILGSEAFDVADVDVTTLALGPEGAPLAHRNGPHVKDANHDGVEDLLAHFRTEETGVAFGDTEACVTGETLDGTPLEGCDFINTQPNCGIGFELALVIPPLMWLHYRRKQRGSTTRN
jgi:hypothetical protein